MEIPERIQKAYDELIESCNRQGVEWINPELNQGSPEYVNTYFYVTMDSATEIIDSLHVNLYRVMFYDGKIRASYYINDSAEF